MSQLNIRKAFEKKLIAFAALDGIKIAFENVEFTPQASTPYYACRLIAGQVENPTFGDNYHRERGVFQIIVCYPNGNGYQLCATKAEALKVLFKRGLNLVENDTTVHCFKTPTIAAGYSGGSHYCIPIRIEYFTNEI